MPKLSSLDALGDKAGVYLLAFELDGEVLGGAKPTDPYDSDRVREAGNLMKRICTKQLLSEQYAISSVRDGAAVRIRCGFSSAAGCDAIANSAGAIAAPTNGWASRQHFVLDAERVEILTAAGIPRDNTGPGRRARERARDREKDLGPRWMLS